MNFQLTVCGLSNVRLSFTDIWPSLPLDDFLAYFLHRVRNALAHHSNEWRFLESAVGKTCILFSDDGTVRRLIAGPPPGLKSYEQHQIGSTSDEAFKTCGEAFDILDDGTREGLVGWLYFAYRSQTMECHCSLRDDVGGYKSFDSSIEKHKHVEVNGVDLIFGDVIDVKKALVAKGTFPSTDDIAILLPNSSSTNAFTVSSSSAALELPDDELLFPLLRDFESGSLIAVQREGISATVFVGSKRLLLPRFRLSATVNEVLNRLRHAFQVNAQHLFLEGQESEGALQPSEQLRHLRGVDGEVHLSTRLPPPPPSPFVNEGGRTVQITAASTVSPQRGRLSAPPTLASASAVPTHVDVSRGSESQWVARHANGSTNGGSQSFFSAQHPLSNRPLGAHDIAKQLSTPQPLNSVVVYEAPKVTCRVDVSDCCSTTVQNGAASPPLVDVVLPDDGLPFTGRDMKQFLVANHVISSAFASPTDLQLIQGNREVLDYDDLHALIAATPRSQHLQAATILLSCVRTRL